MARKKKVAASGGNAPWLNTFADLMNLLLCFFVLLFAMSDVNGEKFEQVSISMTNALGIFEGGGSAIGEGQLISSGMTQLNNLDNYFSNMGEKTKQTGDNTTTEDDSTKGDKKNNGTSEVDASEDNGQSDSGANAEEIKAAQEKLVAEMANLSDKMYDQVSDLTGQYNLGDYVELSIDPEYQFVQLSLKGSILFESGQAEIMKEAQPVLSKLGDVLGKFEGYTIEIIGHTDNVPMSSASFKDNNWLSSARALNAAEFLISNNKLDPTRVKYSGRGEYEPIASNDTEDGRARNRRIEIRIYNELSNR